MTNSRSYSHPHHLVNPSPWPILTAFGAFGVTLGAAFWMQGQGGWTMAAGCGLLLYALGGWGRDILQESRNQKLHTTVVQKGLRYGVLLFLVTEAMLFFGLFWGFFDASLFPTPVIGNTWPPLTIQPLNPFRLPYLNTLVLLLSGTTLNWAHRALSQGQTRESEQAMGLTISLGILFLMIQAVEFWEAPFRFQDGVYGSHFYILTGFHGVHVVMGVSFLILCLGRMRQGTLLTESDLGFKAASWYWHFVDVVWLLLFFCLYWWGGAR